MREFLRNNLLILILLNSGNVFNYFFQIIVGRSLTPGDYGSFNALNSMAIVLAAPVAVLPMVFSRYSVQLSLSGLGQVKYLLAKSLRLLLFIALGALGIGFLAIPWIKSYLHLTATLPIIIMLVQLAMGLLVPITLGVLQGLRRFLIFGLASTSYPMLRLVAGVTLVVGLGWGINGALLSAVVGGFATLTVGLWGLRDIAKVPSEPIPEGLYAEMARYAFPVFLAAAIIMVMGNVDIILVRHYCTAEEAGLYAIAAILGRIALFLPSVLIAVMFPEAAKAQDTNEKDGKKLGVSLSLTALLGGGFAFVCWLWPEFIIRILFGEAYQAGAPLLQTISLAMAMLAVSNMIFSYSLARKEFSFLWSPIVLVGLMFVVIMFYHDTALTIARILLFTCGIMLLLTLAWHFLKNWKKKAVIAS